MSNKWDLVERLRRPYDWKDPDSFIKGVEILSRIGIAWLTEHPESFEILGFGRKTAENYVILHERLHPDVLRLIARSVPSKDPHQHLGKLLKVPADRRGNAWLPAEDQRRVCDLLFREAKLPWDADLRMGTGGDARRRFREALQTALRDRSGFQQRALDRSASLLFQCVLKLVLRAHRSGLESSLAYRVIQQEFALLPGLLSPNPAGGEPKWKKLVLDEVEGFRRTGWLDVSVPTDVWRLTADGVLASQDLRLSELSATEREVLEPFFLGQEAQDETDDTASADSDRQRTMREIWARRGQARFRAELVGAYGARCVLSDTDAVHVLEACHLIPVASGGTDAISNGLLLRSDLHTLFDLDLVGINPVGLIVVVSPRLAETEYQSLHGRKLRFPADPDGRPEGEALRYRWERFLSAQPG